MQLIELALQSSFGSIVYYDGKKSSYLEKLVSFLLFMQSHIFISVILERNAYYYRELSIVCI